MEYKKESLLSQDGLRRFLNAHKSDLKTIANELNVGYSTLRNYTYGATPLDSMPYRLVKALTTYAETNDLFHPKHGIYLSEPAFYALAKLAGREITPNPRAFAIEEYTKALLLLHQRKEKAETRKTFPPRYFFIDLKYQNDFLNEYCKQFTEDSHQMLLQTTQQLQNMYNMSEEDMTKIMTKQGNGIELKSTDPTIVAQLFSLGLPRTGNRDLWSLLQASHNIHLIVTNKTLTDGRISKSVFEYIDDTFSMMERQDKYSFNGVDWVISPNQLASAEIVAHMRGATFDELHLPNDDTLQDHICRNLINLHTAKQDNDIWYNIVRDALHKNWTHYHNLDIHAGSYKELTEGNIALVQSPILAETLDNITMSVAETIKKQIDALSL